MFYKKVKETLEKTKNLKPSKKRILDILEKAKENAISLKNSSEFIQGLSIEEASILLNIDVKKEKEVFSYLLKTSLEIKKKIYGNRLVIFAPLYVSNLCQSGCKYCGFRKESKVKRRVLSKNQIIKEVEFLQKEGHKRLLMLSGDHENYTFKDFLKAVEIASSVKTKPKGEIRRINVEIPSLTFDEFKELKKIKKIGTYTLFQETYHKKTYKEVHPNGQKADYDFRFYTMDRALEAGIDDVGMGILFGLYDYKFDLLSLLLHSKYLDKKYSIGPHTISIPRLKPAFDASFYKESKFLVDDLNFKKIVAVIRCTLPYTGIILSTRETPSIRKDLYHIGVSQISAGSKAEPGGYNKKNNKNSQFILSDNRSVSEVIEELIDLEFIPSWCTACYRKKRTGKIFMDFAKKGKIHKFCKPNALLTFAEYLLDYENKKIQKKGFSLIEKEMKMLKNKEIFLKRLSFIKDGKRDLLF